MLTKIDLGCANQTGRTTIMSALLEGLRSRDFLALMVKPTTTHAHEFRGRHAPRFLVYEPRLALARLECEFGRTRRIVAGLDDTSLFDAQPILDQLVKMSDARHVITVITAR